MVTFAVGLASSKEEIKEIYFEGIYQQVKIAADRSSSYCYFIPSHSSSSDVNTLLPRDWKCFEI